MKNDLISIIIPVYNAEKYVEDIINDVLMQTYQKFELIIVNDGSTDRSGEICEQYAKDDMRITVINKQNQGVSCARNDGIRFAKGEYICFLDADDRIEGNYLEELYLSCLDNNCLMSVCPVYVINELSEVVYKKQISQGIYSSTETLKELFQFKDLSTGPCGKLIHRFLFKDGLIFPVMKTYEDLLFIYKALYKAGNIYFTRDTKYNYIHRENMGTMNSYSKSPTNDVIIAVKEILVFLKDKGQNIFDSSFYGLISQIIMYLATLLKNDPNIKEINTKTYIYETKKVLAKYRKELLKNSTTPFKEKITFLVFSLSFRCYYFICKIIKWRNSR